MPFDAGAVISIVQRCASASQRQTVSDDLQPWADRVEVRTQTELFNECVAVLKQQSDLVIFDDQMQQIGPTATRVTLAGLARWLIRRAMEVGPEEAVGGLRRYVLSSDFPAEATCLLSGVTLEATGQIGDGIKLVSFDALRESPLKKRFTPSWESFYDLNQSRPSAALICETTFPKYHGAGPSPEMMPITTRYAELSDVRLLMTLLGPSAPVIIALWSTPESWVPRPASGMSWSAPPPPEGQLTSDCKVTAASLDVLRELFLFFKRLQDKDRARLRIPLDRLNRALRRVAPTDSAIELGIALESLLLNDLEDERGELTFRLRLRGARFLADTITARKEVDRLLRDVYKARSIAVHTGYLPDPIGGIPARQLLEEGYRLAARAIEKIIRGGPPDWPNVQLS